MALLLHLIVITLSIFFAYVGVRKGNNNSSIPIKKERSICLFLSFFMLLFFIGFRVNVGRDWNNYLTIFNYVNQQEFSFGESREMGFLFLCNLLKDLGFEFQSFIFITSFLTLLLFYTSLKRYPFLLPFAIFIFFMDWGYPVVINTIRQGIALFAFMCAITYIDSKRTWSALKYLLFCLLGALFHYSLLLFIPLYFLGKVKITTKYLVIVCISLFILSHFFLMYFYMEFLLLFPKYDHYQVSENAFNDESTFRLGATLILLLRLAPILVYKKAVDKFPELGKYFVFYFLGLSVFYGFYKFLLIVRFTFYFQFAEIFVISFFLYYTLCLNKKYIIYGLSYIGLFLLNFVYNFDIDFLDNQILSPTYSLMFIDFSIK